MGRLKCLIYLVVALFITSSVNSQIQHDDCITEPTDVVFAMDSSTSLTSHHFTVIKRFVESLVRKLPLFGQPRGALAGVVVFATTSRIVFDLHKYKTADEMLAAVKNIDYNDGITNTHLAIRDMKIVLADGRPNVNKIGVLITDGASDNVDQTAREADDFKRDGNTMVVVGIGLKKEKKLINLASREDMYIAVDNVNKLDVFSRKIFGVVCFPDDGVCKRCSYDNGVYNFRNLHHCNLYDVCLSRSQKKPIVKSCPWGQFWNQDALTCLRSDLVECPSG